MDSLRKSMIEELMVTLKIPQGNFNFSTISDAMSHIPTEKLREFYKDVVSTDTFGNGINAIMKAASKYDTSKDKLLQLEDEITKEAKRLIDGCLMMNNILFDEAQKTGDTFENVLNRYEFKNVTNKSMAILNSVKPYFNIRKLVENIRCYQTTVDSLNAFKEAVISYNNGLAIENKQVKNLLSNSKLKETK